jgi:hypothetical protein
VLPGSPTAGFGITVSEQDRTKNILLANEVPYNTHPYSAIRVAADCYPKVEIEVGNILKRAAWG